MLFKFAKVAKLRWIALKTLDLSSFFQPWIVIRPINFEEESPKVLIEKESKIEKTTEIEMAIEAFQNRNTGIQCCCSKCSISLPKCCWSTKTWAVIAFIVVFCVSLFIIYTNLGDIKKAQTEKFKSLDSKLDQILLLKNLN